MDEKTETDEHRVKVKVHESEASTPTRQAISKATKTVEITDSLGRKIVLKKPPVLAQFRLVEILGPEVSKNHTYINMVLPLLYVESIDGDAVEFPMHKSEVEVLIKRLDDEGIEAVSQAIEAHFQRNSDPAADRAELKK